MTTSVIIVTLNRPECVQRCLHCLLEQTPKPHQIIVVDASADNLTQNVVSEFPAVMYLRNSNGYGRMTASRNIGLKIATGDIIAFLDDDAFAHAGWLANLIATYTEECTGAVGGRALNNQPGEAKQGVGEIGQFKPNGVLTGYFAADPGQVIEVDHVMGCNMSFRREILANLGGFREDYPGISGVREDSDMCLRVKALGYKILFNPRACVDHIGAPQAKGQRFDTRYAFYGQRNHVVLLMRHLGLGGLGLHRYLGYSLSHYGVWEFCKRLSAATVRFGAILAGTVLGIASGTKLLLRSGRDPVRHDADAQEIRRALSSTETTTQNLLEV